MPRRWSDNNSKYGSTTRPNSTSNSSSTSGLTQVTVTLSISTRKSLTSSDTSTKALMSTTCIPKEVGTSLGFWGLPSRLDTLMRFCRDRLKC